MTGATWAVDMMGKSMLDVASLRQENVKSVQ